MKKIGIFALACLGTALFLGASAQAKNVNFRELGFRSQSEMNQYFAITRTEIKEVATPKNLLDTVTISADFNRNLDAPGATPTPAPGGFNPTLPNFPTTPNLPTLPSFPRSVNPVPSTGNPITDLLLDPTRVDAWVTIGMKIWALIASNRPVANVTTQRIAVLPSAQIEWTQLENWQGPASHTYVISRYNGFGMTVMKNTYTVAYNYGGQVNGKGAFLSNATIIPTNVHVLFGFSMNADAQAGQPVNVASKEAPVAAVEMQVRWKIDSLIQHEEGVDAYFLKGDGQMNAINSTDSQKVN